MKSIVYYGVVFLIFCLGCNTTQHKELEANTNHSKFDSISTKRIQTPLLTLSEEAEKEIEAFDDFQNLKSLIKTMHSANPYTIQKYADSVYTIVTAFKENRSTRLKVKPIDARITVLATSSSLLKQSATKEGVTAEALLDANESVIKDYNSLVIQLNELTLAIPDNIKEELLRDSETFRDSIDL